MAQLAGKAGDGGRKFSVDLPRSLTWRRNRPALPSPGQPSVEERIARMRQFDLFAALADDLPRKLAGFASIQSFHTGEYIWRQGEASSRVLFIERGLAKASRQDAAGVSRTYGLYGPGDSLGVYALWAGMKYPTDAVALSEGMTAVLLDSQALLRCARNQPSLSAPLLAEIGRFTEAFIHKIEIVSAGATPRRLAALMIMLVERYGEESPDGRAELPIYLTLEHIGGIIDARIETVTRALGDWKRQGWLAMDGDGFHFARFDRIRALLSA